MSFLIGLLVLILILGLVIGLMVFAIRQMTFIPQAFQSAAIGLVCLIAVVFLIGAMTGQVPVPALFGRH